MRTKLLCLFGAVAALMVPTTGSAASGQVQVLETVTLEADVVSPVAARLVVTTRVRRYVSMTVNGGTATPPVLRPDEASGWLELRDLNNGSRICRSAAPAATIIADPSDAISAATADASCPLDLEAAAAGEPVPFLRNLALRGPGLENGAEAGYTRPATITTGRINGEDALFENVKITRSRWATGHVIAP